MTVAVVCGLLPLGAAVAVDAVQAPTVRDSHLVSFNQQLTPTATLDATLPGTPQEGQGIAAAAPAPAPLVQPPPPEAAAPAASEQSAASTLSAQQAATAKATSIPERALQAYLDAAAYAATEFPACNLEWEFLAAFGEIESHHGRFGGAVMGDDGVVSPGIYGIPTPWGRAVGPMQFIESTWAKFGAGQNPQDIDEAARAAARYLCYKGRNLATDSGKRQAAFSYNHADWYVANIMAVYADYKAGVPGVSRPAAPPADANVDETKATGAETPELPDVPPVVPPSNPSSESSSPSQSGPASSSEASSTRPSTAPSEPPASDPSSSAASSSTPAPTEPPVTDPPSDPAPSSESEAAPSAAAGDVSESPVS